MTDIKLMDTPIDVATCIAASMAAECGGIDVFIGTVRRYTAGKEVVRLEFEAYAPMAVSEMEKIAASAHHLWPVQHIAIYHRTGILAVGEVAVAISVGAAHRAAAFDACRYIIDTLKETVPIWKKEVFEDGEMWVAAHP